jgi:hypothetical protein
VSAHTSPSEVITGLGGRPWAIQGAVGYDWDDERDGMRTKYGLPSGVADVVSNF